MARTILALCLVLLGPVAVAQIGTQASLSGTVTDTSGPRGAGAQVRIKNKRTGKTSQRSPDAPGTI